MVFIYRFKGSNTKSGSTIRTDLNSYTGCGR